MSDTGPALRPLTDDALRNLCLAHPIFRERYEGWEEVGRGAFATVVRTHCVDRGETVAVKIFHHLGDEADQRRFRAEVANSQRIVSPFLVKTYSPFDRGGLRWIEMEFVEGMDLGAELSRREAANDPFPAAQALDVAIAVTSALATAHAESVVHRDLKPANILLPRSGTPVAKLGDFGISRFAGAGKLTGTGAFPGTPKFGSPEAFAGEPLGSPHDVYSLGLCLYLLFTNNRFPFQIPEDCSLNSLIAIHTKKTPYPARTFNPALDPELDALLARCLDKKPARRPPATEVLATLERARERPTSPAATVTERDGRRLRARHAYVGAAVAVLLVAAGLVMQARSTPTSVVPTARSTPSQTTALPAATLLAASPIEAKIQGGFLELQNGPENQKDVALSLVAASGREFTTSLPGVLAAKETALVPLDGFTPPADHEAGFRELRFSAATAAGRASRMIAIR